MPPGKRQSPFIGKLVSTEGILYPRYTKVADILLDPAASAEPAAAQVPAEGGKKGKKEKLKRKAETEASEDATAANGVREKKHTTKNSSAAAEDLPATVARGSTAKKQKKQKKSAEDTSSNGLANGHDERSRTEAAPVKPGITAAETTQAEGRTANGHPPEANGTDATAKKRDKKKKKKKKGDQAKRPAAPSGPGNVEEAQQIRSILGLSGEAVQQKPKATTFSFGFTPQEQAAAEPEPELEAANDASQSDAPSTANKPSTAMPAEATKEEDPEMRQRLRRVMGEGPELVPRRVFVGGMPFYYDEEQVRDYWGYCGEIEELDLMRFPDSGRFKGIAFITFAHEAGYVEALKCDGVMIDEQQIKVKPCTSAPSRSRNEDRSRGSTDPKQRRHTQPAPKTPGYHVAYVGNVAFEASSGELKDMFEGCNVTLVRLHTDKETGKSKGYAHVHFADESSLDRAIQYDGTEFMGREIKVGYAQPKRT